MTQPFEHQSMKTFQDQIRSELYSQWFQLTNDFNPSPSFELVYDHYKFVMAQLDFSNVDKTGSLVSTSMNIWCDHLPEDIPRQSLYAWRSLIVEFVCDQISKNRNKRCVPPNTELLAATRKIVGSLNLFDQAQLMISLQNKAKFSGQLSQALRNDMVLPEQKKDLEQAFHIISKQKNGDLYLAKATENKLKEKKEKLKKQKQETSLPITRSPSPFRLSQSPPSVKKQKLN